MFEGAGSQMSEGATQRLRLEDVSMAELRWLVSSIYKVTAVRRDGPPAASSIRPKGRTRWASDEDGFLLIHAPDGREQQYPNAPPPLVTLTDDHLAYLFPRQHEALPLPSEVQGQEEEEGEPVLLITRLLGLMDRFGECSTRRLPMALTHRPRAWP